MAERKTLQHLGFSFALLSPRLYRLINLLFLPAPSLCFFSFGTAFSVEKRAKRETRATSKAADQTQSALGVS